MRHYPGSVVLGEYFRLINGNAMRWQLLIHYQIDQNRAIYEYLCFRQSRGKFECIAVERREESLGWLTGILWCSCDYQTELVVASSVTLTSDFIQASDNNRSRECEEWGTRRRKEWYLLLPFSDNYQVDALDQFLCSLSFQMKAPAKFSIFALLQFNQTPRYQMNYLCCQPRARREIRHIFEINIQLAEVERRIKTEENNQHYKVKRDAGILISEC